MRCVYRILELAGVHRQSIWPDHHEDPLKMKFREQLYLGQKYYYKAMLQPEDGPFGVKYFHDQTLSWKLPENFVPDQRITLNAGGDLIPYTCITPGVCRDIWKQTGSFFFGADIVFANLETPADFSKPPSSAPEVMLNDMYFNADEDMMGIFCGNGDYKGFDVLSIANNHSLDMGAEGLRNTMRLLQSKKIAYCGAAMNEGALHDFPIVDCRGIRIAFIAATFSFNKMQLPPDKPWLANHIELNQPNADISLLKVQAAIARERGADLVVASLHAGCAYQAFPGNHTINNIHAVCDGAGVDIVIAGHAHHAQPMEIYTSVISGKQHFIAYSLGDFIAYDIFKWGHLPMMLQLEISKGTSNGKQLTTISNITVKAGYMHAVTKRGKVVSLELLDYLQVKQDPGSFLHTTKDKNKFKEVSCFFEKFVLPPHQQHLLV